MTIKSLFLLALLLGSVASFYAQTNKPLKVSEFEDFGCEELKWVTHIFLVEIEKTPDSQGYIIGYDGKYRRYGGNSRSRSDYKYAFPRTNELRSRLDLIKKQLVFLNGSSRNFVFLNGGIRKHLTMEYYVVPNGGSPPTPTPTRIRIRHIRGTVKRLSLGDC
jgi:hypothetical protein